MGWFDAAEQFFDRDSDAAEDYERGDDNPLQELGDVVEAVWDFFSGDWVGLAGDLAEWAVAEAIENLDVFEAGDAGLDAAYGMVGNAGQEAIIANMESGFYDAAEAGRFGGEAVMYDVLLSYCAHPEVVSVILGEAAFVMEENFQDQMGWFL